MSYIDLTQYFYNTLTTYFTGGSADPNLMIELSTNVNDPLSEIQNKSKEKMILVDTPTTDSAEELAGGQYTLYVDTVRLQIWINVYSTSADAKSIPYMLETLRGTILQAMQTRTTQPGLLKVKLKSFPKPTMMYNYGSDALLFECQHIEHSTIAV